MDRLQNVFKEESEDLLIDLEQSLLALEKNPRNESRIDEIFRAMHTLKGNSSMFGFLKISDFVHHLETLYSLIRDKKLKANKEIINCTFEVLDLLRQLVEDPIVSDSDNQKSLVDLTERILAFLGDDSKDNSKKNEADATKNDTAVQSETIGEATYFVSFIPAKNIFEDGTNPLYLIDELANLGLSRVYTYMNIPDGEANVENCYTSWVVILNTETDINGIKDVFMFVEGNADIKVEFLSKDNLVDNDNFIEALPYEGFSSKMMDFSEVELLAKEYQSETVEEVSLSNNKVSYEKTKNKPSEELAINTPPTPAKKEKTISSVRVGSDKLDDLMNLVSELITTQAGLTHYVEDNHDLVLEGISENVEKLSRQLRDIAFSMTLIPFNNLFARFQRMIRDVSNNLGKTVDFATIGGETELDKTIIEKLTDPLLHLLRNSLDHGIETPQERIANGKPEKGLISLKAYYSGVNVYIQIQDDGKGIDPEFIRQSAIKKGLIDANVEMSRSEIFDLIFAPGFSTAEKVTDVSGRGVGMDVVKRNISDIRGEINIDSIMGKGTTISLKLPLTLSITDGLLVKIGETFYLIPLSVVNKCYEVSKEQMKENLNRVIVLDGEQIPFLNLRKEFDVPGELPEHSQIILVENENQRVGLTADTIVGEYQAVLKPLGKYYRDQDFISGGTILGDGTIALVMDTSKIINQFAKSKKEQPA